MSSTADEAARREKFIHHVKFFEASIRHPTPYVGFTGRPGYQFEHHCLPYDASGFLNPEAIKPRTDPDEIRVFIVGDSTMISGTEWSDTVPGRVNERLREDCSDRVRVYNFGVVSSCTEQMCVLIWSRLLDFDPDVLVVVSGGTDAFQPFTFDPRPGYPYNAFINEFLYTHFFNEENDQSWQSGLDYNAVVAAAFDLRTQIREKVGYGSPSWETEVVNSFNGSLIKLVRLARSVEIPICYFLEPIVVRKKDAVPFEKRLASEEALEYLARQYDRFEAVLADVRAHRLPNNLRLADASRVLSDNGPGMFYDIVHYDSLGRTTVGKYLADQVHDAVRAKINQRRKSRSRGWMRNLLSPTYR